jgi:hypothetical protein
MLSKSVASLVVLTALALASSPALAANSRGDVSSSSSARPSTRHAPHRKTPSSKKKGSGALASHDKRKTGGESAVHAHPAEPTRTPTVAASLAEPMVVMHKGKPDAKPIPAIDRSKSPKPRHVALHREKAKELADISIGDKPLPAPSPESQTDKLPDTRPDGHGERHLLTRTSAASGPVPVVLDGPSERIKPGKGEKSDKGDKSAKSAKLAPKPPCLHEMVELTRGQEADKFALSQCDGNPAPFAIERLSVLVRPESAQKPEAPLAALAKAKGVELAPGVRKIDAGLVGRLQQIVDHFGKTGATGATGPSGSPARISVISGYRPTSTGSYHATGQALDMRIDGVSNEALVAFCKTLPDTGCGYYPNSSFVHVDVRAPNTGHVYWIDASGPGESPHYVSAWPPPAEAPPLNDAREASAKIISKLDRELPPLPVDTHPAEAADAPAASIGSPIGEEK